MDRIFAHLPVFLVTVTYILGIGQLYTTGDHSYKTEFEVVCHLEWRGTVNNQKNIPELTVILSQTHNIVSL
jgi:hypothetical protein